MEPEQIITLAVAIYGAALATFNAVRAFTYERRQSGRLEVDIDAIGYGQASHVVLGAIKMTITNVGVNDATVVAIGFRQRGDKRNLPIGAKSELPRTLAGTHQCSFDLAANGSLPPLSSITGLWARDTLGRYARVPRRRLRETLAKHPWPDAPKG